MARRPFQIGPTTYRLQQGAAGWWVVAEWRVVDRHGEKDDRDEVEGGPYPTEAEAREALAGMPRD